MTTATQPILLAERCLTQDDFDAFAALSGDFNAIHVDAAFAAASAFGRTVAHGVMLTALLRALGAPLFENRRIVSQAAMFPAPTFAGDRMHFYAARSSDNEWRLWCARAACGTLTCDLSVQLA